MHRTLDISGPDAWQATCDDRLWLYHLHYFAVLNCVRGPEAESELSEFVARWIRQNSPGAGVGWEPYPISRRVVNWCKWRLAGHKLPEGAAASLAVQADVLQRSLEFDVLGNHLLANAKALIFAGALIESSKSESWSSTGLRIIMSQLREQVLSDGGHYERSPMYHAAVLEDLLDLRNLWSASGESAPEEISRACMSMLEWMQHMTHPDGGLAQFNDAAFDAAPSYAQLKEYASRLGLLQADSPVQRVTHLRESGYVRVNLERVAAFLDVAPLGPDFQPGHGHADTLSFELSLDNRRLVVDTGTSTYTAGRQRQRERGTAAHNTIQIDGVDSSEVWGAFRVGRRAHPLDASVRDEGDVLVVAAAHDGYRRTSSRAVHRRTWRFCDSGLNLRDDLSGAGAHSIRWSIHIAPGVRVEQPDSLLFRLVSEAFRTVVIMRVDPALKWRTEESSYHPEFGVDVVNTRIVGSARRALPAAINVEIRW